MNRPTLEFTQHATIRLDQRGLRKCDAELIMTIGTEVEGGFLVRRKDVLDCEPETRPEAERLRRLQGKRLVCDGDTVITAYPATAGKQRRLLWKH